MTRGVPAELRSEAIGSNVIALEISLRVESCQPMPREAITAGDLPTVRRRLPEQLLSGRASLLYDYSRTSIQQSKGRQRPPAQSVKPVTTVLGIKDT